MCLPLEAVEPKLSETKIQIEKYYYEKYVLYAVDLQIPQKFIQLTKFLERCQIKFCVQVILYE